MPRKPQDVTDAELAVLQVLWDGGPLSIHTVSEILYPNDPVKKYSTVKRLLARLETKSFVKRVEGGPVLKFAATRSRDDLVGHRVQAIVNTLCEGSIAPLLTHLSTAGDLTEEQQRSLCKLIDKLDRPTGRGGTRKR